MWLSWVNMACLLQFVSSGGIFWFSLCRSWWTCQRMTPDEWMRYASTLPSMAASTASASRRNLSRCTKWVEVCLMCLGWIVHHGSLPPVTDTSFTFSEIPTVFKHSVMSVCPPVCINSYALCERLSFIKFYVNIQLKLSVWRSCIAWSRKYEVQTMFCSFFTSGLNEIECAASENIWACWSGQFNSLNTKRRLLYLKTQFVPRSKHFSSRL